MAQFARRIPELRHYIFFAENNGINLRKKYGENPRPLSEQESVRENAVPILDHLAVYADIHQITRATGGDEFDVGNR